MKKIRTVLFFAFLAAGMINFLGVSYFKSSNISAFKNYIEFCSQNESRLRELEDSSEMRDAALQITGVYRAFQEKGITDPAAMVSYHTKNVRKGVSVISNYYRLYKMGKVYDKQVEAGKLILEER